MGPAAMRLRGIGSGGASGNGTPPVNPGTGSGGAGVVGIDTSGGSAFDAVSGEVNDVLAGRITLGMVAVTVVALGAFYVYTRGSQSGG